MAKGKQVHVQCNVKGDTPIEIKWKIQNTQQHLDETMDTRWGGGGFEPAPGYITDWRFRGNEIHNLI